MCTDLTEKKCENLTYTTHENYGYCLITPRMPTNQHLIGELDTNKKPQLHNKARTEIESDFYFRTINKMLKDDFRDSVIELLLSCENKLGLIIPVY